ncbi:MAG: TRAM domain-containing protein, partial [Pirellulales bacterium]
TTPSSVWGPSSEGRRRISGREVEVLVEGPSKSSQKHQAESDVLQLTGRTACDRIAVFEGNRRLSGQLVKLRVYDATAFTLFASVVTAEAGPEVYSL